MTNMEINIGLQVRKHTPINKGDFEQLIFALGETVVNLGHPIVTNGTFAMRSSQITLRTCCSSHRESVRTATGSGLNGNHDTYPAVLTYSMEF